MTVASRLALPAAALERVRDEVAAGYPDEVCGFLIGRRDGGGRIEVAAVRPAGNARADERRTRYRIDPDDYRSVEREADRSGSEVVGFYHSHPDAPARPSEYDRDHAWPSVAYLIVEVRGGAAAEATAWRLADDRSRFEPLDMEIIRIPRPEDDRWPPS